MLKSNIYLLFFLLAFLTSCLGQDKPKTTETDQLITLPFSIEQTKKPKLNSASQIGDYFPDIHQDKKGNFWFATAFSGLAKFDGNTLSSFTMDDGLPHNTILDLTEDKAGNIWIATRNGVSKYYEESFNNFSEKDGLTSNWTSCILADSKGNIWVGTKNGVSLYDGKSWSKFHLPKPDKVDPQISTNLVQRIIEDKKGNIWFGRKGAGVCKYDGSSFIHFTKNDGLHSNSVKSIFEDKNGHMWFGSLETEIPNKKNSKTFTYLTDGGLSRYDGNNFTSFPEIESLSGHEIWDIRQDRKGNIWFAPKNRGIVLFDGSKFTTVENSMNITQHSCVQSILEDQNGNMWFGYSGGIFRLDGTELINITKNGPWK